MPQTSKLDQDFVWCNFRALVRFGLEIGVVEVGISLGKETVDRTMLGLASSWRGDIDPCNTMLPTTLPSVSPAWPSLQNGSSA